MSALASPSSSTFVCRHCERKFKRLEHVQRHERTHTKEVPYKCSSCAKAYPRGDLLRRHEKSAHNIDAGRHKRGPASRASLQSNESVHATQPYPVVGSTTSPSEQEHAIDSRVFKTSQNIVSTGSRTTHCSGSISGNSTIPSTGTQAFGQSTFDRTYIPTQNENQSGTHESSLHVKQSTLGDNSSISQYPGLDPFDLFGDSDTILEYVDFSSLFSSQGFGLDQELSTESPDQHQNQNLPQCNAPNVEQNSISRFGSPLPSINPTRPNLGRDHNNIRTAPCWKVSASEYSEIKGNLAPLSAILPYDFRLPSRHSLSRFLEGCIKGLLEHMPLVHISTWSAASAAPDLLLAMASIGAQFRFEGHAAAALFYAAKAAALHQHPSSKDANAAEALLLLPSPQTGTNMSITGATAEWQTPVSHDIRVKRQSHSQDSHRGRRLQTMQAILCLMVLGSWGPRHLVGEAIAFQSRLIELVREDDHGSEHDSLAEPTLSNSAADTWLMWIRAESLRRTKLMAYTFVNLQSVAYNVPPCMMTSEVQSRTPASQEEWNSKTPELWAQASQSSKIVPTNFGGAFRSLFCYNNPGFATPPGPSSAIGNYALIFAILQSIYMLREGCTALPSDQRARDLRPGDIESISRALQNWQTRWESSPESNIEPQSSNGPVAFNSTALLRLAWIRLHSDLGPCRNLASRNPNLIVEAFNSCPSLHRHAGLTPALLHAAHALSVPVRLGINYVAKTQTLSWSVQHSLCNLECAIFLSKWFEAVAATISTIPLSKEEVGLIQVIRSIVLETGFFRAEAFEFATDEQEWLRLIRHLGTAVAALWAEVFSGTHVFEMVSKIGTSLNMYAKLLEDAHTPINGRI